MPGLRPHDEHDVTTWVADVRAAEQRVGRTGEPLRIMADIEVHLDASAAAAAERKAHLDELDGRAERSDAAIFATTPPELADELRTHVRSRLAAHEVPREIEFLDELPRTTTGKILRRALRED